MKTNLNKLFFGVLFILFSLSLINAATQQIDYNITRSSSSTSLDIQTIKYEPFPVNPGDWFDLWIRVQNMGPNNANNVKFELSPEYPFSAIDSERDFGTIFGSINAHSLGENIDASQVVLKYRVKVEDNAPIGTSNLKLISSIDGGAGISSDIPIEIGETKTDFDVVMQDSTSQGTSFAISNIGQNSATALSVSVKKTDNVRVSGAQSTIIGNLDSGDFTTATFQINPSQNLSEVTLVLAYTDKAGVRNSVEKNVSVHISSSFGTTSTKSTSSSSSKYLYLIVGIVLGILIAFIYGKFKKKK